MMKEWFENITIMMIVFFLVAASIPAGLADEDDRSEGRLYTEVPDLVVTHAKIGDFDADGVCDGMRIFYKNIGGEAIPLDEEGFMASLVINDLYSSGYAGIYNNRVDVPDELEEINPGREFYELIPYQSLLQYGFKPGKDNKVRVVVDTRDDIHELREDNNEGIFKVDDDACRKEDEDNHNNPDDDEASWSDQNKQSCRIAGALFENEGQEFWLDAQSIKVEFLKAGEEHGVFRIGEKLIELKEGHTEEFPHGVIALKGLGEKENRRYAVFVIECAKEENQENQKQQPEYKAEYKDANGEYKAEYKNNVSVEYKIKRQEDVCEGCKKDDACLGIGLRLIEDETPSFCDIDGDLAPQKELGAACQNNYECQSNTCQSGACVDLQAQLEKQMGLLERILSWLEKIFG